ncbi:MAG: prolyl oligopeptidase family serine peptidase, partial [Gammaproteobacteria bacterium]|nr:prolyl oligopeptidase family serine peptidase [Gammaproteobacteria bacterium]
MRFLLTAVLLCLATADFARPVTPAAPATTTLTLTRIMANPDWISIPATEPYWSADGETVYYSLEPHGSPIAVLYAVAVASGRTHEVPPENIAATGSPRAVYNRPRTLEAYVVGGNLYVKHLRNGTVQQLTRGVGPVHRPRFMADGRTLSYHVDGHVMVRDLETGLSRRAAIVKTQNPPEKNNEPYHFYSAEQLRLFESLRDRKEDEQTQRAHARMLAEASGNIATVPFYVGGDVRILRRSLSPNGRWLLLVTVPKQYDAGPHGEMPDYITFSGKNRMEKVRRRVGWNKPAPQSVMLLDIDNHKQYRLDTTVLPGIKDAPLAELRKKAIEWDVQHGIPRDKAEASVKAPAVRPVQVWGVQWSDNGERVAIMFRSIDNKDRWIATVDFDHGMKLVTRNRLTDPAWINWAFNGFGWMHDNETLWYLSEESGYSQLYLENVESGDTRQVTSGQFEVNHPVVSRDDKYIYYRANKRDPSIYELYRLDVASGKSEAITQLGGMNGAQPWLHSDSRFVLSPGGDRVLFYHSSMLRPPELYTVLSAPGGKAERLTYTIKPGFKRIDWIKPLIVDIPSTHFDGNLRARLYLPADYDPDKSYAGAAFIHGAGYLQDAHSGWSYYFHEMMFNQFLTRHDYIVVDVDYRGSKGYGRDWRTAIYRNMGHPEVQDIEDAMHWLEKHYNVDPDRLGVYGGSYGGFMTYMMMFRRPNLFQAGAALRPVADWANYNDLYTSDILNRPNIDPQAYEKSSAINYAQNLKGQLLIEQGVEDNNVFFQDTVHMTQKL